MKILICYDGTEVAERALSKAIETFEHFKPHFVLATVAELAHGLDVEDAFATDEVEHDLKVMVFDAGQKLAADGRNVDVVFAVGNPMETLYEIVKKQVPDYVVVGKRQLTTFGEIEEKILGSVSEYLVHRTVIPILICH